MNNNFFTYRDNIEGKVAIGEMPSNLRPLLDQIVTLYQSQIPNKELPTYHTWYDHFDTELKSKVDKIRNDIFWDKLCDSTPNCIKIGANEMDELYYSNPPSTYNRKENLYGAAGNFDIHKDCIFNFDGIKFYRIIIGLTDGNDNVLTKFVNLNDGKKLNKYDFLVFDFDKTMHQVIKESDSKTSRILLKLHFIVCENCKYSVEHVEKIKKYYLYYEYITRYIMDEGTNPKEFHQFFLGLISSFMLTEDMHLYLYLVSLVIIVVLIQVYNVELNFLMILYVLYCLFLIFMLIVTFYYLRWEFFKIR